jgi:Na+/H+ antiporter NhaD/arsenite permease-like protein
MTDPIDQTTSLNQPDAGAPPPPAPPSSWRPPRERDSNMASIVVGLILVAIGAWYFLEQTIGIRMPRIAWRDVWPVLLILLGVFVIVRSLSRRS